MYRMEMIVKKLGPPPSGPAPMPPGCQVLSTVPSFPPTLYDKYPVPNPVKSVYFRPSPVYFQSKLPPGVLDGIIGEDELEDLDYPPGLPPGLFKKAGKSGAHVVYHRIPF
jgi:hypothetical protein